MEDSNLEYVSKAPAVEDLDILCLALSQGPVLASPEKHVDKNTLESSDMQVERNGGVAVEILLNGAKDFHCRLDSFGNIHCLL